MSLTNTDVCWPCARIQRQSAVMSPQHESLGAMRRRPCPPCLRPSRLPSCEHGCACGLPPKKILLKADCSSYEGLNAADQHWIHLIIRSFLCFQPTLDHMVVILIMFSPNSTNEQIICQLLESSRRLTSNQRGPTWTALKNCLCVGVNPFPSVEDFNSPFFKALFYFPTSVEVDFSICCLAQGCLTGSEEGETGAAG